MLMAFLPGMGVVKVAIANPLKVKAIAEAKTQTDKLDAGVLAQLLRCDFLPEVWIPDKTTRLLREMCAHRAGLVADQTRIKNRIQSLLAQRLIPIPVPVLFNGHGRNWLSHLELATQDRAHIDSYLRILDQIESEEIPMQRREPGIRVQSIPSLDEVYLSENLPPITKAEALPSGERRMLQRMEIADLPQRLQVVRTRTYQARKAAPAPKTKHLK
jgi:hypothetical protein